MGVNEKPRVLVTRLIPEVGLRRVVQACQAYGSQGR